MRRERDIAEREKKSIIVWVGKDGEIYSTGKKLYPVALSQASIDQIETNEIFNIENQTGKD